jgi:hypothetical protein
MKNMSSRLRWFWRWLRQSRRAPRSLRRSLCLLALACEVSACADPQIVAPGGEPVDREATTQEGELVTYVADYDDGHSERWHALRQGDGSELALAFAEPPAAVTGTRVRVQGSVADGRFGVKAFDLLPPLDTVRSAPLTLAAPAQDTYALVLVDVGSGVDISAAAGQTAMFSTTPSDKSFASFYYESSYGKYSVTGDVIGPYSFPMTSCNTTGMFQAIEPQITKSYNHLIYYFKRSSACAFGGLGEEGSVNRPAKRTWMNGSLGCVVLMQEPGHNLGLMHANTIKCGNASFSATPATSCSITEYGNALTPMGSGCHQLNGYEKWYSQWLSGCGGVRVTATGSFHLVPLGLSCPGAVQVLQVPMPATRTVGDPQATNTAVNLKNYYVELRAAAGVFDQYSTNRGPGGAVAYTQPTVSVYVSDDVRTGTSTGRGGGGNSVWTELLNMTPSSTTFTGLTTAGQSFGDPAGGPTITLESISSTGATVSVTVPNGDGGPMCSDGTPLVGAGTECDGGAVTIPERDASAPEPLPEAGPSDSGRSEPDASALAGPEADAGSIRGGPADNAGTGASGTGASGTGSMVGAAGGLDAQSTVATPPGSTSSAAAAADASDLGAGPMTGAFECSCREAGHTTRGPRGVYAIGALALIGSVARRRGRRGAQKASPTRPG